MTIIEPKFKRQEKEVNLSHRWKTKSKPAMAQTITEKPKRTDVKSMIYDYQLKPQSILFDGRYSSPPIRKDGV